MIDNVSAGDGKAEQMESLLATPHMASALDSEQFMRFLDHVPIAIVVSAIKDGEQIVYANPEFEKVSGQIAAEVVGKPWSVLNGASDVGGSSRILGAAVIDTTDFVGTFKIERQSGTAVVDAYSSVIEDDHDAPAYRLVALLDAAPQAKVKNNEFELKIREKDTLLAEMQHRVKNNLQMITALIRIEARNAVGRMDTAPFDRLAGRIGSLQILYALLSDHGHNDEIDLGIYLSEIATSALSSYAVEGIRLDLKVDAYPVSVNVAMPTGLVVNELLTNALKHAFVGRTGGTITLQSLSDGNGCRIVVADNGIGLPAGVQWPKDRKLSALIVRSLRENAKATVEVESSPEHGMRVTIAFARSAAAGSPNG